MYIFVPDDVQLGCCMSEQRAWRLVFKWSLSCLIDAYRLPNCEAPGLHWIKVAFLQRRENTLPSVNTYDGLHHRGLCQAVVLIFGPLRGYHMHDH